MIVRRFAWVGFILAVLVGLTWFALGPPAHAQTTPSPACVSSDRQLQQLTAEYETAKEQRRIYWALTHPTQVGLYRQMLASAVSRNVVTPNFDRIAADLGHFAPPGSPDSMTIFWQPDLLQLVERMAAMAPSSGAALAVDPALVTQLQSAVDLAEQRLRPAQQRMNDLGCYDWMAGGAPAAPAPADGPVALFSRAPAATSLSSEPSTGLVCAETQQVLTSLEREEVQAAQALRMRWVLDNSDNLKAYATQFRSAQQTGGIAGNFDRIATGLAFPIQPGASAAEKLRRQAELLQLIEQTERDFQALIEGDAPIPQYLNDGASRADLELGLDRARYQADLRRQRMRDLNCSSVELPPVEPFARRADPSPPGGPPSVGPNAAQICAETRVVLRDLEQREHETYLLRWAMDDNYHDSYFAITQLRDEAKRGKVAPEFDELAGLFGMNPSQMSEAQKLAAQPGLRAQVKALADRVRAMTGRSIDSFNNPEDFDPVSAAFEDPDADAPPVAPEVRRKEREIEDTWQQAQYQAELRRQRIRDLNCDNLPTGAVASNNGTLQRVKTKLKEDNSQGIQSYTYGDNWAEKLIVGDPPDRRRIRWTFEGVPGSLSPGDEFTIKVTGDLDFQPAGAERGANNSAGVSQEGLTAIREENAYFYQGASREGTYIYKVPLDAKKVVIAIGADNNQGTFMRYCYGECGP